MKYLKGVYVGDVEIKHPETGEMVELNVWMNPDTKKLFALDNMDVDATRNFASDPYEIDVRVMFENTFSGLPK